MRERTLRLWAILVLVLLTVTGVARPQNQTIGLLLNLPGSYDGYTLFESTQWRETYLIDSEGRLVHSWPGHELFQGSQPRILENGNLLRGGDTGSQFFTAPGGGGRIRELDWDANVVWEYSYTGPFFHHHHDMERLPNGNVLLLAWEVKSFSEAVDAGRDPANIRDNKLWPEHIVEVEPTGANGGNIVWKWHVWDHLVQDFDPTKDNFGVVADHPELIDINFTHNGGSDWLHMNAIAYNAELDQIIVSVNLFSEFWIIDHSTTTEEAAGHTGGARGMGGDLLYRWGNPEAYDRGDASDRRLYRQHSTHWIAPGFDGEGNILLFNNGFDRPEGQYSSVEEVATSVDANGDYPTPAPGQPHSPPDAAWTYTTTPPEDMYSAIISSAQRLPNGNTLIDDGTLTATFREVDLHEQLVWLYLNPVDEDGPMHQGEPPAYSPAFRVIRYPPDYPGFEGKDLTPGPPIELTPTVIGQIFTASSTTLYPSAPNPFRDRTEIRFEIERPAPVTLRIYDVTGRLVRRLVDQTAERGRHSLTWNGLDEAGRVVTPGVYVLRFASGGHATTGKLVRVR